jgi:hypothetical protein
MIYRVFFILCFVLTSCKKGDDNKPYNIIITGVVTDQVTGQHVEGATVSLGLQRGVGVPTEGLMAPEQSTSTGPEGRYELRTSSVTYEPHGSISVGTYLSMCIALIAGKSGYIGSDRQEIRYYDAHNSVLDLQLYHYSELNLHIKNDTTNSIDTVDIKLVKTINSSPFTVLTLVFNKRKLDSTYFIKNLFGNWEYTIQVLKSGGQNFSTKIEYKLTPKPDTINNFDISF